MLLAVTLSLNSGLVWSSADSAVSAAAGCALMWQCECHRWSNCTGFNSDVNSLQWVALLQLVCSVNFFLCPQWHLHLICLHTLLRQHCGVCTLSTALVAHWLSPFKLTSFWLD